MFDTIVEAFKAWQRGEKRIAPMGVRGRVYVKKDGSEGGSPTIEATSKYEAAMTARVYRAGEGAWYGVNLNTGVHTKE